MGTLIDQVSLSHGGWRDRHSALRVAVRAASDCLHDAGKQPNDVDLIVNAGIYRDRNLGEPALAALIQKDIGAHPENPHPQTHGTFSFDVSNGTCGTLTALQIVDGFLKSRAVDCALVLASDADPGHGMSERFPFSPAGAALLCEWTDDDYGLQRVHWASNYDEGESSNATVGLVDGRNVLRFVESQTVDTRFAEAACRAVDECLREAGLRLDDVDMIIAAPNRPRYRTQLATSLDVAEDRIIMSDKNIHTASLAAAFKQVADRMCSGDLVLLIAAGAGITAGAALYRVPAGRP
ncbi:3-oxoacyl-[acyl-carrier-protein] synthase-3 [Mycobacterium sp. OAS707]|uniref:3-oxoacyl-[acyl-carrier-protein] synthase III C-terminal domain-containing protein n=1 Tax=Mycobacterium sp. OAS707 TaxID=2663822 RepID=UPI00178BF24A|nr:3-oxoacyl-[acyl-carrier-protein] synthase III C-terminal domain-containing protein [Mycobacterium sp. OAS707]MBE1546441.1 3-oxoacyl-[acyl-carrier-protein] synthase-3 [Mycobacterium sp. OAS707]